MRKHLLVSATSLLAFSLTACGSDSGGSDDGQQPVPTDAAETTGLAKTRTATLLDGLADALGEMEGDGGMSLAMESASFASGSGCEQLDAPEEPEELDLTGLEEALREVRAFADDHVFKEEYVESDDGTTVIYRIDPASACEGDSECVSELTENPLRVAVNVLEDESLAVRLLVGNDRHDPLSARLSAEQLGLTADLSELMDAVSLFMEPEDREDLPKTLRGVIDLSLTKNGEQDFSIAFSVLEALNLEVEDEPGELVAVNIGASTPTSELRLDANTNSMTWRQNLATVDVTASGSLVCGDDSDCGAKEQQGTFRMHLAGMTSQLEMSSGSDGFGISGYGLGDDTSYVALDDERLVAVDLNQNSGRTLDIRFKDTAEGILVTFEPELDLRVATALNTLSESLRVDMPDWLFDEVFDVTLGGDAKPSILIRRPSCDEYGDPVGDAQLEVESGTLTLAASSASEPVTVSAGMCVVPAETTTEEPHPFETVAAGVCE